MIYRKVYRLAYDPKSENYKPQIGFKWRWLSWLPMASWYYADTDREEGFAWRDNSGYGQKIWSKDVNAAENNMLMIKNHFDGIDNDARALKQSVKEFNKTKKHKVKIIS
jgi:hypothetical protein